MIPNQVAQNGRTTEKKKGSDEEQGVRGSRKRWTTRLKLLAIIVPSLGAILVAGIKVHGGYRPSQSPSPVNISVSGAVSTTPALERAPRCTAQVPDCGAAEYRPRTFVAETSAQEKLLALAAGQIFVYKSAIYNIQLQLTPPPTREVRYAGEFRAELVNASPRAQTLVLKSEWGPEIISWTGSLSGDGGHVRLEKASTPDGRGRPVAQGSLCVEAGRSVNYAASFNAWSPVNAGLQFGLSLPVTDYAQWWVSKAPEGLRVVGEGYEQSQTLDTQILFFVGGRLSPPSLFLGVYEPSRVAANDRFEIGAHDLPARVAGSSSSFAYGHASTEKRVRLAAFAQTIA